MSSLIPDADAVVYEAALVDQFDTFRRPFTIYVVANTAVISTSLTYSRFGQHDQNAAINAQNVAVTPQPTTIQGCILYGNKQPWEYIALGGRVQAQQNKIREADGVVRIKVKQDGYDLMIGCQRVLLDGYAFTMNSTPRPHGLLGSPTRWTFSLQVTE